MEWYPITGRTCELQRVLDQNQGAMQLVACVETSGVLYLHNTYEPEGSDEVDSVWQTCYRNTVVFVFVSCVLQTVDALIKRWREEQEG